MAENFPLEFWLGFGLADQLESTPALEAPKHYSPPFNSAFKASFDELTERRPSSEIISDNPKLIVGRWQPKIGSIHPN